MIFQLFEAPIINFVNKMVIVSVGIGKPATLHQIGKNCNYINFVTEQYDKEDWHCVISQEITFVNLSEELIASLKKLVSDLGQEYKLSQTDKNSFSMTCDEARFAYKFTIHGFEYPEEIIKKIIKN